MGVGMKYEAVIFDLNGVICSTDKYHYLAWKKIADELHICFDETVNNRLRGVSRMESLEIILERYDGTLTEAEKQTLADRKNQIYVELLEQMTRKDLSKEVSETLHKLREEGVKLAIGSSSKNAKRILKRLGLEHYFDAVSDGTNIAKSKPDPEVFLKAAGFLNKKPEVCLVVEDAAAGIEAAARGGFDSAGLGEAALCEAVTCPIGAFGELLQVVRGMDKNMRKEPEGTNLKTDLRKAPFYLDDAGCAWVEETLEKMTLEERIGQLFCPIGYSTEPEYLNTLLGFHIGGLFFRDGVGEEMQRTFAYAQNHSAIPLLIPSNLEAGGDGAATDGTPYGKQMACAAAGDKEYAYRLGRVACEEAAAIGINWAFAPVVDVDMNYHNPITNVRTYGNDPETVYQYAKEYMRGAKECHVATTVKHFPGDGVDERDQHLLTSVNTLSMEEWDKTYGEIYERLIADGALTVMAGHIALPSYQEHFAPETGNRIIPASLSKALLKDLLRGKLGFNGLIITDATPMVGFTSAMAREKAVPLSIENGCDMFLFNKDLEEDYRFMMEGYRKGLLSEGRLTEANRRILALKAALQLHERKALGKLTPDAGALRILKCEKHREWAKELADASITLVKDTQGLLPVDAAKYPRVLLEILGSFLSNERVLSGIKKELEKKNFQVSVYEKENFEIGVDNVGSFKEKYDMVIYIGNVENASNQTTNRLNWYTFWGQGNNVPWFADEVPVLFISVANPYHLLDVPMIKTYINCYSNNEFVLSSVVEKITGQSGFRGKSPIDPYCGRKELAY